MLYILLLGLVLGWGCDDREDPLVEMVRPSAVGYSASRSEGALPDDGTTYTFVSYNLNSDGTYGPNTTHSTSVASQLIDPAYHQQPVGYYAYLENPDYSGILQPCEVDTADGSETDTPYGFIKRDPQQGQALYDGQFQTVCLYPAMPVTRISSTGSDRVKIHRSESLYASEPFEMRVDGYEIFDLDLSTPSDAATPRPLIEVRSKLLVEFVQGNDYPFELGNLRLTNPGKYGWYHPLLQISAINYLDDHPDNIYDKSSNPTPGNEELLHVVEAGSGQTGDIYHNPAAGTQKGDVLYWTGDGVKEGFFFFANDYTKDNALQPGIAFSLLMNESGFKITVPLTMNMQRGYAYRLRLTVESLVIRATFQVVDWETGQEIETEIGGGTSSVLGFWTPEGWVPHSSGGDIGR